MEFLYREANSGDKEEVLLFLREQFGKESYQCKPGRYEWQFGQYPLDAKVYLCLHRNEIVGCVGFLPAKLLLGNEEVLGAFSIDTMVKAEYRRLGIGREFHSIRIKNYQIAISSGQSYSNARLYEKMGWLVAGQYFCARIVRQVPVYRDVKGYVKDWLTYLRFRKKQGISSLEPRVDVHDRMPMEMADRVDRGSDSECFVKVDEEYLSWRYENHPYFEYKYVNVYNCDEYLGTCICRELQPGCHRIVDIYCDRSDFPSLIEALSHALKGHSIECEMVARPLESVFRRAGYYVSPKNQNVVYGTRNQDLSRKLSKRSWLVYGGDSDNDR